MGHCSPCLLLLLLSFLPPPLFVYVFLSTPSLPLLPLPLFHLFSPSFLPSLLYLPLPSHRFLPSSSPAALFPPLVLPAFLSLHCHTFCKREPFVTLSGARRAIVFIPVHAIFPGGPRREWQPKMTILWFRSRFLHYHILFRAPWQS